MAGILFLGSVGMANAAPIAFQPSTDGKDTYIDNRFRDQKLFSNYGSENRILIGHADSDNLNITDGLIEFNLSSLPSKAAQATVRLTITPIPDGDGTPAVVYAHRVTSPWDETTVSWNNKPSFEPIAIASALVNNTLGESVEWDITALYNSWGSGMMANFGIYLTSGPTANGEGFSFVSSDNMDYTSMRPVLVITPIPEPSQILLFSMGITLLIAIGLRRNENT